MGEVFEPWVVEKAGQSISEEESNFNECISAPDIGPNHIACNLVGWQSALYIPPTFELHKSNPFF